MRRDLPWFLAWIGVGFAVGLGFIAILSIGLPVLIAGLLAGALIVKRRGLRRPDSLGMLAGAGCIGLLVAALNLDYTPCSNSGRLVLRPGETQASCGGLDPVPWAIVGGVLFVIAVVGYFTLSDRTRQPRA